jgi:N utilization substance protein B
MYRQAKSIETVLHEAISNVSADITVDQKYVANIVMGIDSTKTILEEKLQKYLSEEWKFSRLGKVVQALLLSACYEIIFTKDLPAPIIINEYLEIAKLLNHEGEVGFINNVLDSIVKETAA